MSIADLFSKRQRRLRGDVADVYQYDLVPDGLRVQIVHIFRDAFGDPGRHHSNANQLMKLIHDTLCREYGVFFIGRENAYERADYYNDVFQFVLREQNTERIIDAVELLARLIEKAGRTEDFQYWNGPAATPDQAIEERNSRFREHGVGFQYESGEMIRLDSQLLHSDAVRPALRFLSQTEFAGANEEYLRAHEHYRHGRNGEALNDALKAFESVMKAICDKHNWTYNKNATSKQLIATLFDRGLVPAFMQTHFASLQQGLESGVPTIRNKLGGHGQGSTPRNIPRHIVGYQMHLTASAILFLAECDDALQ